MIGIPFELDLSSLPAPFEPKRIVRDEFHWPGYRDPGEANNFDQIGAWSLLAQKCFEKGANKTWAENAMRNAREWVLHYLRGDGGHKDEAHLHVPGARHYLRILEKYRDRLFDRDELYPSIRNEATALFAFFGPRSFGNLSRYVGVGRPWYEPRLLGRALSNCAAYYYHQIETGGKVPELEILDNAIQKLHPKFLLLDPEEPSDTGWTKGKDKDGKTLQYLVLHGYSTYNPSDDDPYWHYIPWQYFSTLAYGIIECLPLLDTATRKAAKDILRLFYQLAKSVTNEFTEFGGTNEATSEHDEGMVRRLATFDDDSKILQLEPEESSAVERSYSHRWLREDARPMMEGSNVAFQPTCLPLKAREELLEEIEGPE